MEECARHSAAQILSCKEMEEPLATRWPALPDDNPNRNPMKRAAEILDEISRRKPPLYALVLKKLDEWREECDKDESCDISERKAFRKWLYKSQSDPGDNLHLDDLLFAAWCVEHKKMSPETLLFIVKSAAEVKNGGYRHDLLGIQWKTYMNEFVTNAAYRDPMFGANFKKEPTAQLTKAWTDRYNATGTAREHLAEVRLAIGTSRQENADAEKIHISSLKGKYPSHVVEMHPTSPAGVNYYAGTTPQVGFDSSYRSYRPGSEEPADAKEVDKSHEVSMRLAPDENLADRMLYPQTVKRRPAKKQKEKPQPAFSVHNTRYSASENS